MFTTGTKFLLGATVAALIGTLLYGLTQDGTLGTIGLVSAAVALSLLAAINVALRDSNVSALDQEGFEASAAGALEYILPDAIIGRLHINRR